MSTVFSVNRHRAISTRAKLVNVDINNLEKDGYRLESRKLDLAISTLDRILKNLEVSGNCQVNDNFQVNGDVQINDAKNFLLKLFNILVNPSEFSSNANVLINELLEDANVSLKALGQIILAKDEDIDFTDHNYQKCKANITDFTSIQEIKAGKAISLIVTLLFKLYLHSNENTLKQDFNTFLASTQDKGPLNLEETKSGFKLFLTTNSNLDNLAEDIADRMSENQNNYFFSNRHGKYIIYKKEETESTFSWQNITSWFQKPLVTTPIFITDAPAEAVNNHRKEGRFYNLFQWFTHNNPFANNGASSLTSEATGGSSERSIRIITPEENHNFSIETIREVIAYAKNNFTTTENPFLIKARKKPFNDADLNFLENYLNSQNPTQHTTYVLSLLCKMWNNAGLDTNLYIYDYLNLLLNEAKSTTTSRKNNIHTTTPSVAHNSISIETIGEIIAYAKENFTTIGNKPPVKLVGNLTPFAEEHLDLLKGCLETLIRDYNNTYEGRDYTLDLSGLCNKWVMKNGDDFDLYIYHRLTMLLQDLTTEDDSSVNSQDDDPQNEKLKEEDTTSHGVKFRISRRISKLIDPAPVEGLETVIMNAT